MRDKRPLLLDKHIDRAAQHGCSVVNLQVGGLAEEKRQETVTRGRFLQLVDNTAKRNGLAFSTGTFYLEQPAPVVFALCLEALILEDPFVRVLEQAALGLLYTFLAFACYWLWGLTAS